MNRLILINSVGPMGSTLLSGLLEKFGFSNVPLRKLYLHQYLMNEMTLESGIMQKRLEDVLKEHGQPLLMGGVGVIDRNTQPKKTLIDLEKAKPLMEKLKGQKFKSVGELYICCRELYCESLAYKTSMHKPGWHIKLTVDIHRYDPEKLYKRYQEEFETVHMIHLHRDFKDWINSFASQSLVHPDWRKRASFMPHKYEEEYIQYESTVRKIPGLHIHFPDLFKPVEKTAQDLSDLLQIPVPAVDFKTENYDMYSKIMPYQKAFTPYDSQFVFLKPSTLQYFERLSRKKSFSKPYAKITAWLRYLIDMIDYRRRTSSVA